MHLSRSIRFVLFTLAAITTGISVRACRERATVPASNAPSWTSDSEPRRSRQPEE